MNVTIGRLVWDGWNVPHIARHQVVPSEVEEVCQGDFLALRSYQERLLVVGPTTAGRLLAVVLDAAGQDEYYVVTARPASRPERRLYVAKQQGG